VQSVQYRECTDNKSCLKKYKKLKIEEIDVSKDCNIAIYAALKLKTDFCKTDRYCNYSWELMLFQNSTIVVPNFRVDPKGLL